MHRAVAAAARGAAAARRRLHSVQAAAGLLWASLLSLQALGEVNVMRAHVPVVRDLADALSWTSLQVPLPARPRSKVNNIHMALQQAGARNLILAWTRFDFETSSDTSPLG